MVKALAWVLLLPALLGAVPVIERPVTDPGGVLTAAQTERVTRELVGLREATGAQMAVLVVDTTGGEPIEDYTLRVAEAWRGGRKGEDKGLLFVLAVNDRHMRLDVGYGLEASLPDGTVKGLLDRLRPWMREKDYAGAILYLIQSVRLRLTGMDSVLVDTPEPEVDPVAATHTARIGVLLLTLVAFLGLAFLGRAFARWDGLQRTSGVVGVASLLGVAVFLASGEGVSTGLVLLCAGILLGWLLLGRLLMRAGDLRRAGALLFLVVLGTGVFLAVQPLKAVESVLLVVFIPVFFFVLLLPLTLIGPGRWLCVGVLWLVAGPEVSARWNQETKEGIAAWWIGVKHSWSFSSSGSSGSSDSSWSSSSSSDSSWSSSSSSSSDSSSSSSSSDSSSGWSGDGGSFGGGGASSDW
jgi:uncharacterized protein